MMDRSATRMVRPGLSLCAVCVVVALAALGPASFVTTTASALDEPGSSRCTWEPMTKDEIRSKIDSGKAMAENASVSEVRDTGPATPDVVAELERRLAEAEACAFDQRRALRWSSSQFLYEFWPTAAEDLAGYQPEDSEAFESPYLGIAYVREMSDGRIGAVYIFDGPAPSPVEAAFYLFTREGGELVLDDIPSTMQIESELIESPPVGRP